MNKWALWLVAACAGIVGGCEREANVASYNLSREADRFQVNRRIVFLNGITDKYLMSIEGLCSLGNNDKPRELSVTCKTGPNSYKKHFLGLSDNVSYFAEQLEPMPVSTYHYKVVFRPATILPSLEADVGQ